MFGDKDNGMLKISLSRSIHATKKTLANESLLVSAEGIEYHPSCGGTQQKRPSQSESLLVSAEGIEPSTNGLKGRCSAIELRAHLHG